MDRKLPVASLLSLTIAALLGGCGSSDSGDKTTDPVTPTPVAKHLDVRAVDGYLQNAQVWLDTNGDYALTEGEPTAITDSTGKASLDVTNIENPGQYRVLVKAIVGQTSDVGDGTATPKPVTKTFTMAAPAGVSTVTPLTTLVVQQMTANTGMTQEQAAQEVATQLGLGAEKAGELLKDFIAEKNTTGQIYALNIVAALPEVLDDDTADDLLTQGAAIGKVLDDYLAQNPLDDDTQPDDIKVVIGEDGSVDEVIKDSDGDGKDDDDIPPVPSDTLASFLLSASDMYMAGGDDESLWTDHWQSLGNGAFGWKESNILIGKTQYRVDTSMEDVSYRLGDSGWIEKKDSDDIHMLANSDGSVSLTDPSHAGKLTGICQDVGGKTLTSVVGSSPQVVDTTTTFTAGAVGCAVHFSDTATDASYRIDTWDNGENSVNVNGVKASTLAELFSSSAPVAEGPNAIATVFDPSIDTWSGSHGNVRLVLVRSAANATSGVAQLWQYNSTLHDYQLLSDVTPENHQGWTLQTRQGVTLLTLSETIQHYLGDDYLRIGFTEWQGRVQWVDNPDSGNDEDLLLMNKVAYDDLLKGRTLATDDDGDDSHGDSGSDVDPGTGTDTDAATAFAELITSKSTIYTLYSEQGNLGITKVTHANQFMPYLFDYSTNLLTVDEAHLGTGELVVNDDDSVSLMVANEQGVLEQDGVIRCTQVLALDAMPIKTLLAQVTDPAQKAVMEAKFATATFSAGAKAYINTHSYDDGSSDVEVVLNETAYQDLLTMMGNPA